MCLSSYRKDKILAKFYIFDVISLHKDHHQKCGNYIPSINQVLGKGVFWITSWCFFQNRGPYATILAPRKSKGGPGSILSRISVSFGCHFESLGTTSSVFSVGFFSVFSSLFSEVFFSGPGQTFSSFGMHSGVRWELFSMI